MCQRSTDGTTGGYGVVEFDGKNMNHYYKGTNLDHSKQFRTYDRNSIHITGDAFAPDANPANKQALENDYGKLYSSQSSANEVYINVWNWADGWNIEVKENGKSLDVTHLYTKDPLHIIAYEARRLNKNQTPTSSFVSKNTPHIFKVTAAGASSTLEIKVTDTYGNLYTESMQRPKQFGVASVD